MPCCVEFFELLRGEGNVSARSMDGLHLNGLLELLPKTDSSLGVTVVCACNGYNHRDSAIQLPYESTVSIYKGNILYKH